MSKLLVQANFFVSLHCVLGAQEKKSMESFGLFEFNDIEKSFNIEHWLNGGRQTKWTELILAKYCFYCLMVGKKRMLQPKKNVSKSKWDKYEIEANYIMWCEKKAIFSRNNRVMPVNRHGINADDADCYQSFSSFNQSHITAIQFNSIQLKLDNKIYFRLLKFYTPRINLGTISIFFSKESIFLPFSLFCWIECILCIIISDWIESAQI